MTFDTSGIRGSITAHFTRGTEIGRLTAGSRQECSDVGEDGDRGLLSLRHGDTSGLHWPMVGVEVFGPPGSFLH